MSCASLIHPHSHSFPSISMHTLFVREHNRLCDVLKQHFKSADDEHLYQMARKLVGAIVQKIAYNEFLPALLGPLAPSLTNYAFDPSVDPQISIEFSSFAYRFGHSMLSPNLALADQSGVFSSIPLRDAFFNPALFLGGNSLMVDHLIAGLIKTPAQEIDTKIIEYVRSFLFSAPNGQGTCLDLASLNIARGRDHGKAMNHPYNVLLENFFVGE